MKNIFNKTQRAWSFYDWANSVYSLVIGTVLLPIYYETMTKEAGLERMHFMGMDFHNTELYSYVISLSFLIIAILSPYLASLADFSGKKKSFMRVFVTTGSLACVSLFFFDEGTIWLGLTAALMASVGFTGSLVFYNAFLPEVAKPELQDKLSARGFALGYLGSSILLILNLLMIQQPQWFGIEHAGISTRISFLLVGLWWMGFSQYTFKPCENLIWYRQLDCIRVKGKNDPVKIYEVVGLRSDPITAEREKIIDLYHKGRELYLNRQFRKAWNEFATVVEELDPNDKSAKLQMERSQHFVNSPPPDDWDGVFTMTEK